MSEDKFKEKAYEILYNNYKSVVSHLIQDSRNHLNIDSNTGEKIQENRQDYLERKSEKHEQISNLEKWSHYGLMRKEDIAVTKALESCLGINCGLPKQTK